MTGIDATIKKYDTVEFGEGATRLSVLVPEPDAAPDVPFLGGETLTRQCLAAWAAGLSFRLEGPPGVGKSLLAAHLAALCRKPFYLLHLSSDTEPQDLVCTPRLSPSVEGRYVASPLVAAMLAGGVCFGEIGKLPERSMTTLISVLDDQRSIASTIAGFTIRAHAGFRFCAALNPASDPPLPDYLDSRLRPRFVVPYPTPSQLAEILDARCAGTHPQLLHAFRGWIADRAQSDIAPRAAVQLLAFASTLARERQEPIWSAQDAEELIDKAAEHILAV